MSEIVAAVIALCASARFPLTCQQDVLKCYATRMQQVAQHINQGDGSHQGLEVYECFAAAKHAARRNWDCKK